MRETGSDCVAVSLASVSPYERGALERLVQLYCHDWSELVPLRIGNEGCFDALDLTPYFGQPGHHAFLIRVGTELAGFLLLVEGSRLTGDDDVLDVAELFVARGHRARGVGRAAVLEAFARFPGRWEVRQRDENPSATRFWRRVIGAHTEGRFEDFYHDGPTWRGPVQRFSTTRS